MMFAYIRSSYAVQLAVTNWAAILIILLAWLRNVDSISILTKIVKPAFAKVIPGFEIDGLQDKHLSMTVAAITFGKEELQETSRGPMPQLNIDEVALSVQIKAGNKWQLNEGEYTATLKDCLAVFIFTNNMLQLAEKPDVSCLKTASCESTGPGPKRDCKQMLADKLFDVIRYSSLEAFVRNAGKEAGFDKDPGAHDPAVFRKLKSWIQFENIPEANQKSDVVMSWKIAKIQHVFRATFDGRAVSHHAIRLTTTAKGSNGKPIELLVHMADFWGEGITRYDASVYKVLTNVRNPIKPDKAVLPKSEDLTVGKLLECVSGENLSFITGKCVAYVQRFLRYATGDVSDCKKMKQEVGIVPFSDEALKNRLELTDEGMKIVDDGDLGRALMKELRRKPGQPA